MDNITNKYIQIAINSTLNFQEWNGTVSQRDTSGIDTSITSSGKEVSCNIQSTLSKKIGPFDIVANLLVDGVIYKKDPEMIVSKRQLLSTACIQNCKLFLSSNNSYKNIFK